jgi:predicted metallo-beta-lactamase superfamily hydrolase
MSSPSLDKPSYEARKQLLEDMKILSKDEYEEIFRIIKRYGVEYSENSNGIFFDLTVVDEVVFQKMSTFLEFCKTQRNSEKERLHEMDALREETKEPSTT